MTAQTKASTLTDQSINNSDTTERDERMSSLDATYTLQPEELWPQTTLQKINNLSDADAVALLPRLSIVLQEEINAWSRHCTTAQSTTFASIISQADIPGADLENIKAKAIHHVLQTMPARFRVLACKNRVAPLGPLSETLNALKHQVDRNSLSSSTTEIGSAHFQFMVQHVGFARTISEQEDLMTELEVGHLNQLRQMLMMISGTRWLNFTSTQHIVEFAKTMQELDADIDSIFEEEEEEEASEGGRNASSDAEHESNGE